MLDIITDHLDIWTTAQKQKKAVGRGRAKKDEAYGIKKLRELILELAVQGKLVPQDASDESASVLLEKIAEEKQRLIEEGVIKKKKSFPEIENEEKPFYLPANWLWVRIDGVGYNWGQKKPDSDFTYIDVSAIDSTKGVISSPNVLSEAQAPSRARKIVKRGTVIYSTVRPYLQNICVVDIAFNPEPIASTAFAILHPFQNMPSRYLTIFLRSPVFIKYVESVQTGIAYPAINDKQFFGGIIPIPPLAEQYRIVAKVDELMALCDQLEQQQADHQATHQTLVKTLLKGLINSAKNSKDNQQSTADFFNQLIAQHFDTLFTTEDSIDQLKQTILQLAVMGKLVPQDPNDEPASVLLEKIAKEKAKLIEEGKIKKQKALLEIGEDEKPFELPNGWGFIRLNYLSKLITKGSSPKWQGVAYTDDPTDILFVTSENVGSYKLKLDTKKYVEKKFNEVEPRSILIKNDFLMNIVGASIGRTAIYNIDDLANINQAVCLIRVFSEHICDQYLLHFFNSDICLSYMFDKQVDNARANLSMSNIAKFVIPFPPLEEQHRIVTKVNQLLTLCDSLKANLNQAQTTQTQLADAIVKQAVN